jgi:RsiW-degrading membrane proteinase PrsW (M82 family)
MSRHGTQSRKNTFFAVCLLAVSLAPFAHASFLQEHTHLVRHVLTIASLAYALVAALLGPTALQVKHRNHALAAVVASALVSGGFLLGLFALPFAGVVLAVYLLSDASRARAARTTPSRRTPPSTTK